MSFPKLLFIITENTNTLLSKAKVQKLAEIRSLNFQYSRQKLELICILSYRELSELAEYYCTKFLCQLGFVDSTLDLVLHIDFLHSKIEHFFPHCLMERNAVYTKIHCEALSFSHRTQFLWMIAVLCLVTHSHFLNYKFVHGKYISEKKVIYQKVELFRTMRAMWLVAQNIEVGQKCVF